MLYVFLIMMFRPPQRVHLRTPTITSTPQTSMCFTVSDERTLTEGKCSRIDISDEFSFGHMLEFSKLAVAFAIELGGWAQ